MPSFLVCLLALNVASAQQPLTNLAASRGLLVPAGPVYTVDSSTTTWTGFLDQLDRNPRNHLFTVKMLLQNNGDSTLPLSLSVGEFDFVDVTLGTREISAGRLRHTPPEASYPQRQAGWIPLTLPRHSALPLTIRIRQTWKPKQNMVMRLPILHTNK